MERHLRSWRKREQISCWRAYDGDLPEYAAAIDVYGDWLHVQEYQAPASIPEETAARRFDEIVGVACDVFDVPQERVATKQRRRQSPGERYGRMDDLGEVLVVEEGGLRFEVNLLDYLDTGLFLDHRPARARVRELAAGQDVLNLFAYTGTATVYAAAGGARSTTSVDLSATYLDWAERNIVLNGLNDGTHALHQTDAMTFLRRDAERYGLIFVDPPTFSNSKRATDFDVQRHHVPLLRQCLRTLRHDGTIIFSTNFRRFELDAAAIPELAFRDVTRRSIPPDFERNPRIHRCWEARRVGVG